MEKPLPQPRFRAALIGLGRIASLLEDDSKREKPASHAGALVAHGGFDLVGGCDSDPERRRSFGQRWELPETSLYNDPVTLLTETRPDLVVIATWPDSHEALVKLAARHHIPLILCEKPLAPTPFAARRMVRACHRAGVQLMVNHERRYARDYARARQIIADQRYGQLVSVMSRICLGRQRTPAEVLFWDGTHLLDILRYLTGQELTHIRSWGRKHRAGDSLYTRFCLGLTEVILEIGTTRDHLLFELDLSFERGRLRIGNGLFEEAIGGDSPHYDKMRSLLPVAVDPTELYPTGYFSGMVADAFRVLTETKAGRPAVPVSTGLDGLRAVEAIRAILRS